MSDFVEGSLWFCLFCQYWQDCKVDTVQNYKIQIMIKFCAESSQVPKFVWRTLENFKSYNICDWILENRPLCHTKQNAANSHTHALPMHSVFARLSWLACFSRLLFADPVKSHLSQWYVSIEGTKWEVWPRNSPHCQWNVSLRLVALSRLSVDTSWCHSYSKQSIQVCFTTSFPHPPPPTHPLPSYTVNEICAHLKKSSQSA